MKLPSFLQRCVSVYRRWDSTAWLAAVTGVGVAVAVYAGAGTYRQWQNDKVLSLEERWGSGAMQARRSRLTDAFACKGVPNLMVGVDPQGMNDVYLHVVLPSKNYDGVDGDVAAYLDFFDDVQTCVETEVCNPKIVCERFSPEAQWLNRIFGPFMERQRVLFRDPDYGRGFELLAKSCADYVKKQGAQSPFSFNEVERNIAAGIKDELNPETKGFAHYQQAAACRRMRPPVERTISE